MAMPHLFWLIFLFMLGACVGSFLNVVIYRVPRNQSIVFPPSHCPGCGKGIRWYDNIPLLSWILLKGRCRFCKCAISPRYLVIEAVTAMLVVGLYLCYYVLDLRAGTGPFLKSWPMFAAHAALLCGLLACAMVDIESWIVPLEVCWVVSLGGAVAAALKPHLFLLTTKAAGIRPIDGLVDAGVSPVCGAVAMGALLGLALAVLMLRFGYLRQSFIDASDRELDQDPPEAPAAGKQAPPAVAVCARREILWEILFLLPAILLAAGAWAIVTKVPAAKDAWILWHTKASLAKNLLALEACVWGYLIGGLWIWGMRILGTLAFGRLAMGMGDVHLLAAVGAVTGWIVPSVVFFVAPVFGLAWAVRLWVAKAQKELPYGPWLALATLVVMLFHDAVVGFFGQYALVIGFWFR